MKGRFFYKRFLCALSIVATAVMCMTVPLAAAATDEEDSLEAIESAEAATIQLMKIEGDVSVSNSGKRNLSIIENMKLYNGYQTSTEEASYAWINLDSEKLTKQDAVSETEIRKSGKKLEILLKSGNLFFDVTEPLEEEEILNIRTSTMVMGIRGTCGWVKVLDRWTSEVYILEGTVQCRVKDPVSGQIKDITLKSGEMARFVVYSQSHSGDKCDIIQEGFTQERIDGFVLEELAGNRDLCDRIQEASGLHAAEAAENAAQRLARDEADIGEILREMHASLAEQESHISQDPVWVGEPGEEFSEEGDLREAENPAAGPSGRPRTPQQAFGETGQPAGDSEADPPTSSGSGSGSASSTDPVTPPPAPTDPATPPPSPTDPVTPPPAPTDPVTPPPAPTDPVTPPVNLDMADNITSDTVQEQLNQNDTEQVTLSPDTTAGADNTLTVAPGTTLTIPAGKSLTVEPGVTLEIPAGATVVVDGGLDIQGELVNNGTIIVSNGG